MNFTDSLTTEIRKTTHGFELRQQINIALRELSHVSVIYQQIDSDIARAKAEAYEDAMQHFVNALSMDTYEH